MMMAICTTMRTSHMGDMRSMHLLMYHVHASHRVANANISRAIGHAHYQCGVRTYGALVMPGTNCNGASGPISVLNSPMSSIM